MATILIYIIFILINVGILYIMSLYLGLSQVILYLLFILFLAVSDTVYRRKQGRPLRFMDRVRLKKYSKSAKALKKEQEDKKERVLADREKRERKRQEAIKKQQLKQKGRKGR